MVVAGFDVVVVGEPGVDDVVVISVAFVVVGAPDVGNDPGAAPTTPVDLRTATV